MRKFLPLLLCLLTFITLSAQDTLLTEQFTTSGEGSRYVSNHAVDLGNNDYWERTNTSGVTLPPAGFGSTPINTAPQGGNYWATEDINNLAISEGILTFSGISITGYGSLVFNLYIADPRAGSTRWDINDYLLVEANIDGGGWTAIGRFLGSDPFGTELQIDDNLDGIAGPAAIFATTTFTEHTFAIAGSGTSMDVRIRMLNNASEELGIDNISVLGTLTSNDPPVLATIEGTVLSYTEGSGAQNITSSITVSDTEGDNITGGTVDFSAGFDATEDVLSVASMFGVTGVFAGSTLTLTGTTTIANYQTILRAVQYTNIDATDPSLQDRSVRFTVTDGQVSNTVSRDITIDASIASGVSLASTVCEGFETDGNGTRYQAYPHIVGSDYWTRFVGSPPGHGSTITSITGTALWGAEDVVNGSNPNPANIGEMILNAFDATALNEFTVDIDLAVGSLTSWETTGDYCRVQYRIDAGSWITQIAFYGNGGGGFQEDTNLDGSPDGTVLTAALQTFSRTFTTTGTSLEIRVIHDSDGSEELAFDQICVSGILSGNTPPVLAAIETDTLVFTEGSVPHDVTATMTVFDADSDSITGATIDIIQGFDSAEDSLTFTSQFWHYRISSRKCINTFRKCYNRPISNSIKECSLSKY